MLLGNFWWTVAPWATKSWHLLAVFHSTWETKIYYLDLTLAVNKNILKLQITVADVLLVEIFHCVDDLSKDCRGTDLVKDAVVHDIVEEIAAWSIFHDDETVRLCVNDIKAFDDIWVLNTLHDLYLTIPFYWRINLLAISLGDDFDSVAFLRSVHVMCESYFTKSSLPDFFTQDIVSNFPSLRLRFCLTFKGLWAGNWCISGIRI